MGFRFNRLVCLLVLALVTPCAFASFIVVPHTSGADGAMSGNTVASPYDPGSASATNPAGVASDVAHQIMVAVAPMNFTARYSNQATGYNQTSSETVALLNFWYGLGEWRGWKMGIGIYGAAGAAFNLAAEPENGVNNRYLGTLTVVNIGFTIGRKLSDDLRIGFQLTPRYGTQELETPTPLGTAQFEIGGFGITGAVGLVYDLTDDVSLGLAYQTPGVLYLDGEASVGGNDQSVDHELITPQAVNLGVAYQWTPKLQVLAQASWTDYEQFENGEVDWSETDVLDQPIISNARSTIRWGAGFAYEILPDSTLRLSFTYETWMIEPDAMRPYLFDSRDLMVMAGYHIHYDTVGLGFIVGYADNSDRHVSPAEAGPQGFPGHYSLDTDLMAGIHITWHK